MTEHPRSWRKTTRKCANKPCDVEFQLKRQGQRYCSTRCRNSDAVSQHRKRRNSTKKSDYLGQPQKTPGGCRREAITASQETSTKSNGYTTKKRHLYLFDEAPSIGCGWRLLTVTTDRKGARLLNQHTGVRKRLPPDVFDRIVAGSEACKARSEVSR